MTPTWEDGTEPLVGGGLVQAGKVDRQVRAALAAAKEVQTGPSQNERLMRYADETREEFYKGIKEAIDPTPDIPKIGCVGHDCAECRAREAMRPTVPDNMQDWKGMDGTIAWHLIERHADNWADVGKMMDEWFAANQAQPQPTDGLQNIAAYIGVGGLNGATSEQLEQRIKVEIDRLAAQTLELQAKCKDYEAALKRIQDPIAWEQNNLPKGYRIDGPGLMNLVGSASYYQNIAREALAKHGGAA